MPDTAFSAPIHGFPFPNHFSVQLPVTYALPYGGAIDLNQVCAGLGGGMCFAALDFFYAGQPVPGGTDVAAIDPALLTYLSERQLDSLPVATVLKIVAWTLLEPAERERRMNRYEIPRLRRSLERGKPAVLALLHSSGLENPAPVSMVVATGYREGSDEERVVLLYDPAHPGEAVELRPGRQSSGEAVAGWFTLPYRRQRRIPVEQPRRVTFAREVGLPFYLAWPVDSRRLNQGFGENPDSYKPFGLPGHEGLDLYALPGANIYACADGEVTQAEFPKNHPYGLQVRIRHQQNGKVFHTIYAHLSETLVRKGQRVSAGQKIALADNTGNSFGSHLHLTLKIEGETTRGYPTGIVDPWPYLSEEVATEPAPEPDLPASSGVSGYTTADLNLRAASSASAEILALIPAGERLDLLGDPAEARARIGQENVWLPVRTAGGKGGYVAAWYVQNAETAFPPTGLVVYPNDAVNLRSGPATTFALLASLTAADALTVLGDEAIARGRIGKANEWLQVQAPNGQRGFVAAWLVHRTGQNPPASSLTVYPTGLVNLRARPDTEANVLAVVSPADALTVLGDAASAAARIGREGEWLQVRAPNGLTGSIAAWLVALQPVTGGTATALTLYPTTELNLRAQPSINSPRLGKLTRNAPFQVMETDLAAARVKVGQNEQWIYGQAAGGERGWAAAWYLGVSPV